MADARVESPPRGLSGMPAPAPLIFGDRASGDRDRRPALRPPVAIARIGIPLFMDVQRDGGGGGGRTGGGRTEISSSLCSRRPDGRAADCIRPHGGPLRRCGRSTRTRRTSTTCATSAGRLASSDLARSRGRRARPGLEGGQCRRVGPKFPVGPAAPAQVEGAAFLDEGRRHELRRGVVVVEERGGKVQSHPAQLFEARHPDRVVGVDQAEATDGVPARFAAAEARRHERPPVPVRDRWEAYPTAQTKAADRPRPRPRRGRPRTIKPSRRSRLASTLPPSSAPRRHRSTTAGLAKC